MSHPLRIASVPSDHVYVRHLSPLRRSAGAVRLPDPPVPGAPAGQWWPSPVLDPQWLRVHAPDLDVVSELVRLLPEYTIEIRPTIEV